MIKSIKIQNYRKRTRPCVINFDPKITFVIGRNATGRKTLLSLLEILHIRNIVSPSYLNEDTRKEIGEIETEFVNDNKNFRTIRTLDGLHYTSAKARFNEFQSDAQYVITTQNPSVIDLIEISSAERLRQQLILTSRENDEFVWRNPTYEEAALVVDAYNVGIQSVSEVLRDRGLW